MLRAISPGEWTPVGGDTPRKTDFRIIAATSKSGKLINPLRSRLGYNIRTLALHKRPDDIDPLARHFLERFAKESELGKISLGKDALADVIGKKITGNARGLETIIQRAALIANSESTATSKQEVAFGESSGIVLTKEHINQAAASLSRDRADKTTKFTRALTSGIIEMTPDRMQLLKVIGAVLRHKTRQDAATELGMLRTTLVNFLKRGLPVIEKEIGDKGDKKFVNETDLDPAGVRELIVQNKRRSRGNRTGKETKTT